jgi:hypothetical protein
LRIEIAAGAIAIHKPQWQIQDFEKGWGGTVLSGGRGRGGRGQFLGEGRERVVTERVVTAGSSSATKVNSPMSIKILRHPIDE